MNDQFVTETNATFLRKIGAIDDSLSLHNELDLKNHIFILRRVFSRASYDQKKLQNELVGVNLDLKNSRQSLEKLKKFYPQFETLINKCLEE